MFKLILCCKLLLQLLQVFLSFLLSLLFLSFQIYIFCLPSQLGPYSNPGIYSILCFKGKYRIGRVKVAQEANMKCKKVVSLCKYDGKNLDVNLYTLKRRTCNNGYSAWLEQGITQQTHDVVMTSYGRRCDVIASHRRQYDVISTSCACWEGISFIQTRGNFGGMTIYLVRSQALKVWP